MSERKVINKYYPVDFDPSIKARTRDKKKGKATPSSGYHVRMAVPFLSRCLHCNESIARGSKFNMDVKKDEGETYLGLAVFQFFFKCPGCSRYLSFRTDPKLEDYVPVDGMKAIKTLARLHREKKVQEVYGADELGDTVEAEEKAKAAMDPMEALEARTAENKRRIEENEALQDLRAKVSRQQEVDPAELLQKLYGGGDGSGDGGGETVSKEERDELVRLFGEDGALVAQREGGWGGGGGGGGGGVVKRVDMEELRKKGELDTSLLDSPLDAHPTTTTTTTTTSSMPIAAPPIAIKRRKRPRPPTTTTTTTTTSAIPPPASKKPKVAPLPEYASSSSSSEEEEEEEEEEERGGGE